MRYLITKDRGLGYVGIYKVAYSSTKEALKISKNYEIQEIEKSEFETTEVKLKFAIVRDPWKRLISCYRNRVIGTTETANWMKPLGLTNTTSWENFLKIVSENLDAEPHWGKQASSIYQDGRILVDVLVPIDRLGVFWNDLKKEYGLKELVIKNESKGPRPKTNQRQIDLVKDLFREDYEIWESARCQMNLTQ